MSMMSTIHSQSLVKRSVVFKLQAGKGSRTHLQSTELASTYLHSSLLPLIRHLGDAASSLCRHSYRAACTLLVAKASHEVNWLPVSVGSGWIFSARAVSLEDNIHALCMISRVCGLKMIK